MLRLRWYFWGFVARTLHRVYAWAGRHHERAHVACLLAEREKGGEG